MHPSSQAKNLCKGKLVICKANNFQYTSLSHLPKKKSLHKLEATLSKGHHPSKSLISRTPNACLTI